MEMRLPAAFYSIWNPTFHVAHPFQRIRRRMGFAERGAEGIWGIGQDRNGGSDAGASGLAQIYAAAGAYSFQSRSGVSCRASCRSDRVRLCPARPAVGLPASEWSTIRRMASWKARRTLRVARDKDEAAESASASRLIGTKPYSRTFHYIEVRFHNQSGTVFAQEWRAWLKTNASATRKPFCASRIWSNPNQRY